MTHDLDFWARRQRARLSRRRLMASGALGLIGAAATVACTQRGGSGAGQAATSVSGAQTSGGTPVAGGTLTVSLNLSAQTLDPQRTILGVTLDPVGAAMSRLLRFKTGIGPAVAESHEVESDLAVSAESPDATTWTIKLRPNAKFHNIPPVSGHAVEAEDVKATFLRALDPKNPNLSSLDMLNASQIQAPSADTVVFKLNYPYAPFKSILASPSYSWIFPREVVSGDYDPAKQLIGSGPFIFDSFTPDVVFVEKKNPEWFIKDQPYISELHWSIISDTAQMEAQFAGGHLDVMGNQNAIAIPPNDLDSLKRNSPKAQLIKATPGSGGPVLFFQLGDSTSPFQDIRLRQAFSMAIDRDTIAKAVFNNNAERQYLSPLNLGKWVMRQSHLDSETAPYFDYKPADAKKLLDAAGATGTQFKLIYANNYGGPDYIKTSEAIANMLSAIGVKITPVLVDYQKDFIDAGNGIRNGNYAKNSVVMANLGPFNDIDQVMFTYWHSRGSGPSRLHDSDVDAAIAKARTLTNDDERLKAYMNLQKYVASKVYAAAGIPISYQYAMVQPWVQNYQLSYTYGYATESFTKLWLQK